MRFAGGYVLHVDAMHEGGVPALMTGMDSLSDIILSSVKISSENTENTSPFPYRHQKPLRHPDRLCS